MSLGEYGQCNNISSRDLRNVDTNSQWLEYVIKAFERMSQTDLLIRT